MKRNFWFLLGLYALVLLIRIGSSVPLALISGKNQGLITGLNLLFTLAYEVIFTTGTAAVALKICDQQKPKLGDFLCDARTLGFFFLALVLSGALIMAGFILLIIPGVYAAIRLSQTVYYVVEQKKDPIEAVKCSWEATKGMAGALFVYFLAVCGLMMVGFLCLVLGIIPVWFVTIIASAYLYRVLNQRMMARPPQKELSTPSSVLVQS